MARFRCRAVQARRRYREHTSCPQVLPWVHLLAKDIVNLPDGPYNVGPGGFMVIQSRTDVGRNRLIYILTIILSVSALITSISQYSASSDATRALLLIVGGAGVLAFVLSVI